MASGFDVSAASALAGAAVYQIHSVYTSHAGKLEDARSAPPGDYETTRRLIDADIVTGLLVAITGGMLSKVTGRGEPLFIAIAAFGVTSLYYHAACNGDNGEVYVS